MEENKPKENKQKKHKLNRKSFLKILGLSLTSHFVFLNLGKHKAWAAVASGCRCGWSDFGDNPPVQMCGWMPDLGCQKNGPPDKCNLSSTPPDPDLCKTKTGISDSCNEDPAQFDPDKCYVKKSLTDICDATDPDSCNTASVPPEPDNCGGSQNQKDSCNPSANNPDKCGKKNAQQTIIGDTCFQGIDTDNCGTQDENGGSITDICNPPNDPDICDPVKFPNEPDICDPPESTDDVCEPAKGETHITCPKQGGIPGLAVPDTE